VALRNCSVRIGVICLGSIRVFTTQVSGATFEFSSVNPSVLCASGDIISGFGYPSGFSSTAFTTEKVAVSALFAQRHGRHHGNREPPVRHKHAQRMFQIRPKIAHKSPNFLAISS